MSGPTFSYVPAPHERGYYGALFQAADTERSGAIGGAKAVEFFTRSKVPVATLKQIWTVSDQPPTNSLDPRKFAVAVRLIQLEQNGLKPSGPDLAQVGGPNLRPAFFEGVASPPASPAHSGPPPPPQQQQQQQQPPTPPRPPMPGNVGGGGSVAGGGSSVAGGSMAQLPPPPPSLQQQQPPHLQQQLTVQDPYTLNPQEQARYEQLFPEYCKQDPNYMYGSEAVALFSKSGLEQQQLARIWGMVDHPVDNRLDKLEFAMAMHLIVCVSKKNLPMPPGLPLSLKQLKSQQPPPSAAAGGPPGGAALGGPPPIQRVGTQDGSVAAGSMMGGGGPPPIQVGGGSNGEGLPSPQAMRSPQGLPSPQSMMQAPSSPQQQQQHTMQMSSMPQPSSSGDGGIPSPGGGGGRPPVASNMSNLANMPGPPPISQMGGVSISDAFEGLGGGDTGSISSYRATTPYEQQQTSYEQHNNPNVASPKQSPKAEAAPAPAPASRTIESPKTTKQLASSYNMGEAHEELEKLKAVLQKLQAENISLKATMGSMTEEEKDIQKELSATVAEVSKLSNELTTLRAQVLASKSRLLEASAELKATKEKKDVIKDLIAEANATKRAIDEAHEGIESANEAAHATPPAPAPAPNDTDFFGGWGSDAPPPAPLPAPTQNGPPPQIEQQREVQQTASDDYSDPQQTSFAYVPAPAPAPAGPGMFDGGDYKPGHERNLSGFGEVMGSGPGQGLSDLPPVGETLSYGGGTDISGSFSMAEVEVLKTRSKEADDVARDANESLRQLTAQLDEMRRLADEAESKSREAAAKPVKKKGLLKRGGAQKKDAKELEKLASDAREKKEKLMQVQAQVKDAEALAEETKKEAERLNKEAEEAQMQAAAMASMQQQQPQQKAPQPEPTPHQPTTNGYPPPSYGMPPPSQDGGFGGPPLGGGFNPSVMGSGGTGIPAPANNADDPYINPFGSD